MIAFFILSSRCSCSPSSHVVAVRTLPFFVRRLYVEAVLRFTFFIVGPTGPKINGAAGARTCKTHDGYTPTPTS
jgi:hypothetical protein